MSTIKQQEAEVTAAAAATASPSPSPSPKQKSPNAKRSKSATAAAAPAPAAAAVDAVAGGVPESEKKKRKVDETQSNKTLNTQANIQLPGISASKAATVVTYLRWDEKHRLDSDQSVQKPKGVAIDVWNAVPIDQRTIWVFYYRLLKDTRLTMAQFPFTKFQALVRDEAAEIAAMQKAQEAALEASRLKGIGELNARGRTADRRVLAALKAARSQVSVSKELKDNGVEDTDSESENEDMSTDA